MKMPLQEGVPAIKRNTHVGKIPSVQV